MKNARTGGAAFAVDRENGEQRGVERALDIGVFKKISTGDFSAKLHGVLFQAGVFFMMLRPVAVPPVKETARTS